jgi:hypothetical protein
MRLPSKSVRARRGITVLALALLIDLDIIEAVVQTPVLQHAPA